MHLTPVRRDVRENCMNMWDAPGEMYREFYWSKGHMEKLAKVQDKLDMKDIQILAAINKKRPVEDYFNFKALAEISGFDEKAMIAGIKSVIEEKRILAPLVYTNWQKLGLSYRMFVVRLFQITPCHRKAEIVDELAMEKDFDSVWEYTDSFYDIGLWLATRPRILTLCALKFRAMARLRKSRRPTLPVSFAAGYAAWMTNIIFGKSASSPMISC